MGLSERQADIFKALKALGQGNQGLEPLKKLFWTQLNYPHQINSTISRRNWSDTAAKVLVKDPLLFASAGTDNDYHIIYAQLNSDKLQLGAERPVVSRLLQDHPYALFIFSDSDQKTWHFVNVKYDRERERRRLFRRITVGPEERLRTAAERLEKLDLEYLSDPSPLEIQERNDEAFDVEAVTKEFFKVFAIVYHQVSDEITKVRGLEKQSRNLAQLLLDRMLFLYFIQKKGWLDRRPDYLYSHYLKYLNKEPKGYGYYSEVLYPLFLSLSDPSMKFESIGAVPFLNGGLFEESRQTQVERLAQARLQIPSSIFQMIFEGLLERFNFTITEDTPLDVEVAIDPEMLGKIFECLTLQLERDLKADLRKLTGSYYTPRPIVHFICNEALKEHLVSQLTGSSGAEWTRERIEKLLSLPPADQLDGEQDIALTKLFTSAEMKTLRSAILQCRICDPAVGSGAFLVGMLHEMVAIIARVDRCLHGKDILHRRNYFYDIKKQIIESCLYGVDIQEQAVRLCELRLWLSLVVDYQVDTNKSFQIAISEVPSLPNLSYRILRGDSLLEQDAKLQTLKKKLLEKPLKDGKRLIFTQYADTARYLYENLNPDGTRDDIDVIYSGDKSKAKMAGRFAPHANPEYHLASGKSELMTLIATDVFAEGLNLQDCDKIINYDLHWNPVRLIQRFGRIDRIGSNHDIIYGYNFLPETGLEKNLGLKLKLRNRIQEIHDTIGEDAAILDKSEQLNEEAMYAIYEKRGTQLGLYEEEEEFLDLNEAEEILLQLRKDDPSEYARIATLRDGIRTAKPAPHKGTYVFCEASYPEDADLKGYQQLFLLDEQGEIVSRDIPRILGALKCGPELAKSALPAGYNATVTRVKQLFAEEVKHRQSERAHTLGLSSGQRYILREMRLLFGVTTNEESKAQINVLEKAFRGPVTKALNKELNLLRRNGVEGESLLKTLANLFHQHNMRAWTDRQGSSLTHPTPKIVCSEALGVS